MPYDVAVVGAGYVGLPLAATFAEGGCRVLVVDVVPPIVEAMNRGESHIEDVETERLRPLVEAGSIRATTDRIFTPTRLQWPAPRAVSSAGRAGDS